MKRRITVRGVCVYRGSLLCAKQKHVKSGQINNFWCIPGGGLDFNEDLVYGLKREMIEETGVTPEIGSLLYVQQYHKGDTEYLEFFFHIKNSSDYLNIELSNTTHGELEIDELKFINTKQNKLLPTFLTTMDIDADIKSGKTQIFNYLNN